MMHSSDGSSINSILRRIAVVGVVVAAVFELGSISWTSPNQIYSIYALIGIAVAVAVSLIILNRETRLVLNNPDLLVPLGLYLSVNPLMRIFSFPTLTLADFDLRTVFGAIGVVGAMIVVLQIVSGVLFVGWTTRLILEFVETGKTDLAKSFRGVGEWFWKTLGFLVCGQLLMLSAGLAIAVFGVRLIPVTPAVEQHNFSIPLVVFFALALNLLTAGILPSLLRSNTAFFRAIADGAKLSWSNKRKTVIPIALVMAMAGTVVYVSVQYRALPAPSESFGERRDHYRGFSGTNNLTWAFTWTANYPERTEWHKVLLKTVKTEQLSSVNLRLAFLMLLLSVVANLRIVRALFGDETAPHLTPPGSSEFEFGRTEIIAAAAALALLAPIELFSYRVNGSEPIVSDFVPGKIYRGENLLSKSRLFSVGDQNTVDLNPTSPDDYAVGSLNDIKFDKARQLIIAAGSKNALELDLSGKIVRRIDYKFESVFEASKEQSYFRKLKLIDIDDNGDFEFVGLTGSPASALVLDSSGLPITKIPGETRGINLTDVRDVDGDGKKEILVFAEKQLEVFDLNGRQKATRPFDSGLGTEVYPADTDSDGKTDIIGAGFSNRVVLKFNEEKPQTIKKPDGVDGVIEGEAPRILYFSGNKLGLFDFAGNLHEKYDAPLTHIEETRWFPPKSEYGFPQTYLSLYNACAVRVKLRSGEAPYMAVLAAMISRENDVASVGSSMLYVYNPAGDLVYHESLDESYIGRLSVYPNEDGSESLLVYWDKNVFSYKAND